MSADDNSLRILIGPPKVVTSIIDPGSPEAQSVIATRFSLIRTRNLGFATFAQMVFTRALISINGEKPNVLATLRPSIRNNFELAINFSVWMKLSTPVRRELLKAVLLRIPLGHFSSRVQRLLAKYGPEITQTAVDIVISQIVNTAILAEEGIYLPVPELYKFDRNLTIQEYCELLSDKFGVDGGAGLNASDVNSVMRRLFDTTASPAKDTQDITDKNGMARISDIRHSDITTTEVKLDELSKEFIRRVENAMQQQGSSLKTQGDMPGAALEFIDALDRPAKVPWHRLIRSKFCQVQTRLREQNPKRPSRRPALFVQDDVYQVYKGDRVKKKQTRILVVVDTSGSMSPKELRCIQAELKYLALRGADIYITHVDAGVAKEPAKFRSTDALNEFFGRGGTSFKPGFDAAETMRPAPAMIVYFTDGYGHGTAPAEQKFETLWLLTSTGIGAETFKTEVCPWGDIAVIDVEDDD